MPRRGELSGDRGLAAYRAKRDAERTPEPFGAPGLRRPGLFVVQHHAARHRHFDLRLEWGGALLSWAVPKGPSLDPADKRFAVQVEDHPVDYADFEGVIPEGNYGAGEVIVWDLGRWHPVEDPAPGLERGKLLFDLEGYKLRGRFTLVRTGRKGEPGREWLLIKKSDAWAEAGGEALDDTSVLSGLRVEELRAGAPRVIELERSIARSGATGPAPPAAGIRPMLAERIEQAFSSPEWLFEPKLDGYRLIAAREEGEARLYTRSGQAVAARFPEIAHAVAALPADTLVLDGELAVTDAEGRPSFERLQRRARLERAADIERARVESPTCLFVFDLLAFGDRDLRDQPLSQRKRWLEALLPRYGPLRLTPHFAGRGEELLSQSERLGLEGIVAKRADSPYRSGRSPAWKKLRLLESDDFAIVGYSAPRGGRPGFGALHLASHVDGELRYFGRVGSGFRDAELLELRERLDALRRDTPACSGAMPQSRGHVWVEPRWVGEVRFAEVTRDGNLRQPTWLRLREDKTVAECVRETPREDAVEELAPGGRLPDVPAADEREVPFTNLDKVFWPDEGFCKGDLIDYHRAIAPWLLPYLRDRPLVMTRYPDGIAGKSFFQKDAPSWVPDWLRTERLWSEQAEREVNYFVCDDLPSLLYVINLGTIPLHVWSSRFAGLAHPDWCILDLDPKGAPFSDVVAIARELRSICDELDLPCHPKTSGASGLHVLLPLGGQLRYEQSRMLAELIARLVVERRPEIATLVRSVRARKGRVYIDYLQNGHGRLLASPFCVRPLPGAPVSMPLRWREIGARLDPGRFTIRNAVARLRRMRGDPLAPVLDQRPDLEAALAQLAERVGGAS